MGQLLKQFISIVILIPCLKATAAVPATSTPPEFKPVFAELIQDYLLGNYSPKEKQNFISTALRINDYESLPPGEAEIYAQNIIEAVFPKEVTFKDGKPLEPVGKVLSPIERVMAYEMLAFLDPKFLDNEQIPDKLVMVLVSDLLVFPPEVKGESSWFSAVQAKVLLAKNEPVVFARNFLRAIEEVVAGGESAHLETSTVLDHVMRHPDFNPSFSKLIAAGVEVLPTHSASFTLPDELPLALRLVRNSLYIEPEDYLVVEEHLKRFLNPAPKDSDPEINRLSAALVYQTRRALAIMASDEKYAFGVITSSNVTLQDLILMSGKFAGNKKLQARALDTFIELGKVAKTITPELINEFEGTLEDDLKASATARLSDLSSAVCIAKIATITEGLPHSAHNP